MKRKSQKLKNANSGECKTFQEQRAFEDGETVLINRPHLWSGCSGEVVSFANGLHRVKITGRPDGSTFSHFHADVPASQLESWL